MQATRTVLPVLLALAFALALAPGVAAADGIEVSQQREQTDDPGAVTFVSRVQSVGLASATLVYKVLNPDGDVGGTGEGTFTPGVETDLTFTLNTNTATRYIPVGSRIRYHWELEDRDGSTLTTPEREFVFLDGRFQWESRTDGLVTVFWYGDSEQEALAALGTAKRLLDDASAILETEVPYPVRVMVYRNEDDGRLARRPLSPTFEASVIVGGQRVAPDLLLVFDAGDVDVIRHETTHIVTHVAGDGPFADIPAWIDEGFAVYMQSSPGGGYSGAIEFAITTDRTLSLRSLQSPAQVGGEVNLFYGQSFSTVEFLIEEFGPEQFAEVYRVFFAGSTLDNALEAVFGFDQNGLYNLWRESKGLPTLDLVTPPSGSAAPVIEATITPLGDIPGPGAGSTAPTAEAESGETASTPTPPAAGSTPGVQPSDDGSNTTAAIAVGAAALLLAGALGGGALLLTRRRGSP